MLGNNVISPFSFLLSFSSLFSLFLFFFFEKQNLTLEMKSTGLRTTRTRWASIFYRPRAIILPFLFLYIYILPSTNERVLCIAETSNFWGKKKKKEKEKRKKREIIGARG